MKWTDIDDIVEILEQHHPNINILSIRFTDLAQWVMELPGFSDSADRCNEKILEAIQMTWLEERGS